MSYKIKNSPLASAFILLLVVGALFYWRNLLPGENNSSSLAGIAEEVKIYCEKNAAVVKGKENCYAEEFKKLAEQKGPEMSFQILNDLQAIDQETIGCHLIAHGIGWGSYRKEPDNWRSLAQNMPTICNYGAIHGVIESYILSLPDKSLSREVIPTICGERPRADCNHIVGHLLLVQTDAEVDPALELCTVFTDQTQKEHCISGVFMEYQTALNLVDHDLVPESWLDWGPRLGELEALCRSHSGQNAVGCWEEIVHVALVKFQNDPQKIFDFCSTAQVKEGTKRCKRHSIGIMGASKNFHLPSLKDICTVKQKDYDPTFEKECYPNLVSSALSTIPSKVPESVTFCNSIREEFKISCFSMIGIVGKQIPTAGELLVSSCQNLDDKYRPYCLGEKSDFQQQITRSND